MECRSRDRREPRAVVGLARSADRALLAARAESRQLLAVRSRQRAPGRGNRLSAMTAWRSVRALVAMFALPALSACAALPVDTRRVVLSYSENPSWCTNCPVFDFEIHDAGTVAFHCRRGCAVPGDQHFTIPRADFSSLVDAFHRADFFSIPRLPPRRWV